MRAAVADASTDLVRIADVAAPAPTRGEVLVAVSATSVNRGELHRLRDAAAGWRPGWDFAGTVVSGTAFQPGQRVLGIAAAGGAWAQRVALPADHLAAIPDGLDDEHAAALPVAAVTARRVLCLADRLAGRRVLVTGAAGGVGRFAVQLAAAAGAEVTAVVRDRARATGLAALGAGRVVTATDLDGRFDIVLESAGGQSLERALEVVDARGLVVAFGNSTGEPVTVPLARFYPKQALLRGYHLLNDLRDTPPAADLAALADLAARGLLRLDVDIVHDLAALPDVLRALAERRVAGKAVLRVPPAA